MDEGQLHGKVNMENQTGLGGNKANAVDAEGDIGEKVRKEVCLHYLTGAESVMSEQGAFEKANPEFMVHSEVDEIYPTHKD